MSNAERRYKAVLTEWEIITEKPYNTVYRKTVHMPAVITNNKMNKVILSNSKGLNC